MICHDRRFIFIHICRCAGSSIEWLFGFDPATLNEDGERHARPGRYDQYWKNYFTFVTVRNPWDRLVSAFQLTKEHDLRDSGIKNELQGYGLGSFNDFVKQVLSTPGVLENTEDRLFWPQARWLLADSQRIEFDMIVRYETLSQDMARVGDRLGVDGRELPHVLATNRPSYRDIYDREAAALVADLYRDDIDLLEYRF